MSSLNEIKAVIKKISEIGNLGQHMCFFGGSVPYIYYNKESNREHSDIDILIDKKYIDVIRQLAKQNNLYIPKLDSLNLDLGDDYGLKIFIDGVYVEFEPMYIDNGMLVRKSFSPNKELAGTESIPFKELTDLIVSIDIEKYHRVKKSLELSETSITSYEDLRSKKTL